MSLDSGPSAALVAKKHDIARTVLSRKRKLCDLYAVATSTTPIPTPYRDLQPDSPENHPLAIFLGQNDLEKGRYFHVSTLPPRPQQATFNTRSQRNSKGTPQAQHQPHLPLGDVVTEKVVRNETPSSRVGQTESEPDHELSNQRNAHPDGIEPADDSLDHPKSHPPRASKESGRSRLAATAVSDTRELRSSKHSTPVPAIETRSARPSPRRGLEKPSRPESPPYSPGSEAIAAGPALIRDASSSKARDPSANVLTPTKDEHDDIPSSQEHGDNKVDSSKRPETDTKRDMQRLPPSSIADAAETLSSHSSVTGHHSANSPRSDPRSPFTSPDEDVTHEAQASTSAQHPSADDEVDTLVESRPKSKPDTISSTSGRRNVGENEAQADAVAGTETSDKSRTPGLEHVNRKDEHENKLSASVPTPDTHKAADTNMSGMSPAPKKSPNPGRTNQVEPDEALPMDVDEPTYRPKKQPSPSPTKYKPPSFDKARLARHTTKHRRKIIKIGPNKPNSSRTGAYDRERLQHPKSKSNRTDYFRPQVVRDVLNTVYKQDLNALLTNCNVTLTTLEWMLHNEEELYRILLQRTQHLQNTNRWSLKQIAVYEEPAAKPCHWDYVLQEAKWLRTDFREERKLKISVARQLAYWCAEWVNATSDQRAKLQAKAKVLQSRAETRQARSEAESMQLSLVNHEKEEEEEDVVGFVGDEELVFGSPDTPLGPRKKARISKKVLNKIPEYSSAIPVDSQGAIKKMLASTALASREQSSGRHGSLLRGGSGKETKRVSNLTPLDTTCALFNPEFKPMRNRLNAVWIYKPPQLPMPSQGFYEYRTPSQWTWEDDQQLRQNVKDYGVNWHLISQNMTPRQEFYTTSDRRTPWECYERLLILDPPQHDIQARQYLKHFHFRIEKARVTFEEQQSFMRTQAQQHAREVGQPTPNLPHKRFPTPTRVERKPSKRLLAMIDASRKLARKRETMQSKQEKSQQVDAQAQKPPTQPSNVQGHTPQYFSRLKHERELKDMERMREQQRMAMMEQQRRQAGYQASLTNGIGQQMRNGMASGQVAANGHLAVPSHNQFRPPSQQAGIHGGIPNGIPSHVQTAANTRAQANMQNQQRLVPHLNGPVAPSQENMARLMQQAAAQQQLQQQQQQQRFQQLNRGSPNMVNAHTNPGMIPSYNTNNQFASTSDGLQSPTNPQQSLNNPASHQSPHIAQALAAAVGSSQQQQQQIMGAQNAPQALSSGHVPQVMTIQHQIQKQNPNITAQEARNQVTEQLKYYMRQNALNAASGMPNSSQQPTGGAGGNGENSGGGGSQSPYLNPTQRQSPFQQNGILASNHHQPQGRGQSPNAPTPLQQSQYQAQLRQQMYNQQRQHQQQQQQQLGIMPPGSSGSGGPDNSGGASASPGLAHALPSNLGLGNMGLGVPAMNGFTGGSNAGNNRTPTPGGVSMRPPSRAAAAAGGGIDMAGFGASPQTGTSGGEQQRPGSAAGMGAQSPRAMSAQGFSG